MLQSELQVLYQNRQNSETLNATKERLMKEGKLPVPGPVENEKSSIQENENYPTEGDEDGFFSYDLVIPRWKINQPTSRTEGTKPGLFRNILTGEECEKFQDVVFLQRQNGRVLFPENDFSGEKVCWSYDGCIPATQDIFHKTGKQPKASRCVTKTITGQMVHCPLAQWKDEQGKSKTIHKPPACKETIAFLGLQNFLPFFIGFHGSALVPIKNFIATVYLKKKQAAAQNKNLQLRDFKVTLATKLEINEKGKFYRPVVEKLDEITNEDERAMLAHCFESLRKRTFQETLVEEEAKVS